MKASSWMVLALLAGCTSGPSLNAARGDITIAGTGVHPESVTSAKDGTLFTGSIPGIIYRAGPKDTTALPFVTPNAENGLQSIFGVYADDAGGRLLACSAPVSFGPRTPGPALPSAVVAFDLKSGKFIARYPFPAPGGTCNDMALGPDGALYASDTPGGRILRLRKGARALEVAVADDRLKGIDGLAFGGDGALIINNVQKQEMWRVKPGAGGAPAVLTKLNVDIKLAGPDGLRSIGGNRFLQAEGTAGRATLLTITGDNVHVQILREGLQSSPGVTLIGHTVYAIEGKINYLVDPALKGKDPGPFKAIAIPLPR